MGSPAGAVLERETTPSHTGSLSNSMHATDKVKSDNTVKSETDKIPSIDDTLETQRRTRDES